MEKKIRFRTLKSINKRNVKEVLQKYSRMSENGEVTLMFNIEKDQCMDGVDALGVYNNGMILVEAGTKGNFVNDRLEVCMRIKARDRWVHVNTEIPLKIIIGPINACWAERIAA